MLAWPEFVRTHDPAVRSEVARDWHDLADAVAYPARIGVQIRLFVARIGEPASSARQRSQTASMAPLACDHPRGEVDIRGGHPRHVQHGDDRVGDLGLLDHATQGGA